MARDKAFNDVGKFKYDVNELNLVLDDGSFVRVDAYMPAELSDTGVGEIISRKATDLEDCSGQFILVDGLEELKYIASA